jgi:putative ABC transport system permease protein
VDFDFFKTLDLEILDGRAFSQAYSTDPKQAYIVNEAAVEAMRLEQPVGKGFIVPEREGRIVGVVKDAHLRSMRWSIAPRLFYMADMADISGSGIVLIKITGSRTVETLKSVEHLWAEFNPVSPFEFRFLDETYDQLYRREQRTVLIFNVFTALALVISCLGLFGLAVFMTELRTKEIGIRKVLGAATGKIVLMLTREFMKWVLIANIFAWPLGYFAAQRLLEAYAYRVSVGIELFVLSGAAAALIALFTVMVRSYSAAAADPATSLRYE